MIIDVREGELMTSTDVVTTIPPRSEIIIPIKADDMEIIEQQIILGHTQEINKNVLCANILNLVKIKRYLLMS